MNLIEAAKTRVPSSFISGMDFLKFVKIIDRFATIEAAQEAINGADEEVQNNPETLASALGFDLSHQIIKITEQNAIEMPIKTWTGQELKAYSSFLSRQNLQSLPSLVSTASSMLTTPDVPAATFLRFMELVDRFATIEAAQLTFTGISKEEIGNDPEKLAKACGFSLSRPGIKFSGAGFIELPIAEMSTDEPLYHAFFVQNGVSHQENFDRAVPVVNLAKSVLNASTVSSTSFYKILQLAQELQAVEGITDVFSSVPKKDIQDSADKLALALLAQNPDGSIADGCRAYFVKEVERGAYPSNAENLELLETALGKDDSHVKTFATLVEQAAEKAKQEVEVKVTEYS